MSRLKADILLLITASIWGTAFLFQKTAMDVLGPFAFIAARFALSALVVFPLALHEARNISRSAFLETAPRVLLLAFVFVTAVVLQQLGMLTTTVTNAGFLTGLYALLTPVFAWMLFRQRPPAVIWVSASLSLFGVWLLGDASFSSFNNGDLLVIACALFYGIHTVLVCYVLKKFPCPLTIAVIQYLACALVAAIVAFVSEPLHSDAFMKAMDSILFAGVMSGGIAYTLQFVAQRHTPPSDAAIIMSSESLFAALAGVSFMGDRLSSLAWFGCGAIIFAILLIELAPLIARNTIQTTTASKPGLID